ncbi:MAG: hypothetical protein ACT4O3_05565 [Elusimicrobiota bacterium]
MTIPQGYERIGDSTLITQVSPNQPQPVLEIGPESFEYTNETRSGVAAELVLGPDRPSGSGARVGDVRSPDGQVYKELTSDGTRGQLTNGQPDPSITDLGFGESVRRFHVDLGRPGAFDHQMLVWVENTSQLARGAYLIIEAGDLRESKYVPVKLAPGLNIIDFNHPEIQELLEEFRVDDPDGSPDYNFVVKLGVETGRPDLTSRGLAALVQAQFVAAGDLAAVQAFWDKHATKPLPQVLNNVEGRYMVIGDWELQSLLALEGFLKQSASTPQFNLRRFPIPEYDVATESRDRGHSSRKPLLRMLNHNDRHHFDTALTSNPDYHEILLATGWTLIASSEEELRRIGFPVDRAGAMEPGPTIFVWYKPALNLDFNELAPEIRNMIGQQAPESARQMKQGVYDLLRKDLVGDTRFPLEFRTVARLVKSLYANPMTLLALDVMLLLSFLVLRGKNFQKLLFWAYRLRPRNLFFLFVIWASAYGVVRTGWNHMWDLPTYRTMISEAVKVTEHDQSPYFDSSIGNYNPWTFYAVALWENLVGGDPAPKAPVPPTLGTPASAPRAAPPGLPDDAVLGGGFREPARPLPGQVGAVPENTPTTSTTVPADPNGAAGRSAPRRGSGDQRVFGVQNSEIASTPARKNSVATGLLPGGAIPLPIAGAGLSLSLIRRVLGRRSGPRPDDDGETAGGKPSLFHRVAMRAHAGLEARLARGMVRRHVEKLLTAADLTGLKGGPIAKDLKGLSSFLSFETERGRVGVARLSTARLPESLSREIEEKILDDVDEYLADLRRLGGRELVIVLEGRSVERSIVRTLEREAKRRNLRVDVMRRPVVNVMKTVEGAEFVRALQENLDAQEKPVGQLTLTLKPDSRRTNRRRLFAIEDALFVSGRLPRNFGVQGPEGRLIRFDLVESNGGLYYAADFSRKRALRNLVVDFDPPAEARARPFVRVDLRPGATRRQAREQVLKALADFKGEAGAVFLVPWTVKGLEKDKAVRDELEARGHRMYLAPIPAGPSLRSRLEDLVVEAGDGAMTVPAERLAEEAARLAEIGDPAAPLPAKISAGRRSHQSSVQAGSGRFGRAGAGPSGFSMESISAPAERGDPDPRPALRGPATDENHAGAKTLDALERLLFARSGAVVHLDASLNSLDLRALEVFSLSLFEGLGSRLRGQTIIIQSLRRQPSGVRRSEGSPVLNLHGRDMLSLYAQARLFLETGELRRVDVARAEQAGETAEEDGRETPGRRGLPFLKFGAMTAVPFLTFGAVLLLFEGSEIGGLLRDVIVSEFALITAVLVLSAGAAGTFFARTWERRKAASAAEPDRAASLAEALRGLWNVLSGNGEPAARVSRASVSSAYETAHSLLMAFGLLREAAAQQGNAAFRSLTPAAQQEVLGAVEELLQESLEEGMAVGVAVGGLPVIDGATLVWRDGRITVPAASALDMAAGGALQSGLMRIQALHSIRAQMELRKLTEGRPDGALPLGLKPVSALSAAMSNIIAAALGSLGMGPSVLDRDEAPPVVAEQDLASAIKEIAAVLETEAPRISALDAAGLRLEDGFRRFLESGLLRDMPMPALQGKKGEAFFIDARGAEIRDGKLLLDAAVAWTLFQRLAAARDLISQGKQAEFVLVLDSDRVAVTPAQAGKMLESILLHAGPVGREILDAGLLRRLSFQALNLRQSSEGQLRSRIAASAKSMNVQILTNPTGVEWWAGLNLPLSVSLTVARRLAVDLARINVQTVFSGMMAAYFEFWLLELKGRDPELAKLVEDSTVRGNGRVTLTAVQSLDAVDLDQDAARIEFIDLQA